MTAVDVRLDAIARLVALAGTDPYDPNVLARRPDALHVLHRQALRRNPAVRLEADVLLAVALGDSAALYDATAAQENRT
jgi:hypothetical protein